jgi:hypothetical protein
MSDKIPNPGSKESIDQGCTCPVMDNHHGKGRPVTGPDGKMETAFWVDAACPLHGVKDKRE